MDISFEKLQEKMIRDGYSDADKKEVQNWQEKAIRLAAQLDFKKHFVTQKLAESARREIERIDMILKEQEEITEIERKALFREKKTHQFYLKLFTYDPTPQLDKLGKQVNEEL